jgi:hypothetical protein
MINTPIISGWRYDGAGGKKGTFRRNLEDTQTDKEKKKRLKANIKINGVGNKKNISNANCWPRFR